MRNCGCYALYKGDTFIDLGTKRYLAEALGVTPATIGFYSQPAHRRKHKGDNYIIVIRIEDDEE